MNRQHKIKIHKHSKNSTVIGWVSHESPPVPGGSAILGALQELEFPEAPGEDEWSQKALLLM